MQREKPGSDPRQDAFLHMQPPVSMETSPSAWSGHTRAHSGLCARSERQDASPATRSLRRPARCHSQSPPPPFRSCSIPIIPSVQCHHDNEASCMQTSIASSATTAATPRKDAGRAREGAREGMRREASSSVTLLLEEAQEQLRALAHRKQEVSGSVSVMEARETVCFLNPHAGGCGGLSSNGPTETQLLSPNLSHRDLGQTGQ